MLTSRVARAGATLAGHELVVTLTDIATQRTARADIELAKAVCDVYEDDVLDRVA